MKNRLIIITAALAVLVITIIAVALLSNRGGLGMSTRTLVISQPVATNAQYAHLIDPGKMYYFSGSSFVSFNLNSQQSTPLTPVYSLPNVVDVRWSTKGALFKATNYSAVDQLYPMLKAANRDTEQSYWWYVNFATGKITIAGHPDYHYQAVDAVWVEGVADSFMALETIQGDEGETTDTKLTQVSSAGTFTDVGSVKDGYELGAANDQAVYYLAQNGGLKVFNRSAKTTKSVVDKLTAVPSMSSNGQSFVYLDTTGNGEGSVQDSGKLTTYDVPSQSTTVLAPLFNGTITRDQATQDWAAYGIDKDDKPIGFIANQGKVQRLALKTAKKETPPNDIVIAGMSGDTLLLRDDQNQVYVAGSTALSTKSIPDQSSIQATVTTDNYYLVYDDQKHQYSIYIFHNPFHQNVDTVMNMLRSKGFDPYQLNIKWYAYDGVNIGS